MNSEGFLAQASHSDRGGVMWQLAALRPHERRLLLAAVPVLLTAQIALWCLPLRRVQPIMARLADMTPAPHAHTDYADRAARAVNCARCLIPGVDKHAVALATLTLLRRRGLTGRLCQGLHLAPEGMRRHVWVEHNGRIILGDPPAAPQL